MDCYACVATFVMLVICCEANLTKGLTAKRTLNSSGGQFSYFEEKLSFHDACRHCYELDADIFPEQEISTYPETVNNWIRNLYMWGEHIWIWALPSITISTTMATQHCRITQLDMSTGLVKASCTKNKYGFICKRSNSKGPQMRLCSNNSTFCLPGYQLTSPNRCDDIDECKRSNPKTCKGSMMCENKPGSYKCYCKRDMQTNGINACGYVFTFHQEVNFLDYNSSRDVIPHGVLEYPVSKFIRDRQLEMKNYNYNSEKVKKIVFKEISLLSISPQKKIFNVTYDLYTDDATLSPRAVVRIYKKRASYLRKKRRHYGWRSPKPVLDRCTASLLGAGEHGERHYRFPETALNGVAFSREKGPGSVKSAAIVRCKTKNYRDGSTIGYFDHRSLNETNCTAIEPFKSTEPIITTDMTTKMEVTSTTAFTTEPMTTKHETTEIKDTTTELTTIEASTASQETTENKVAATEEPTTEVITMKQETTEAEVTTTELTTTESITTKQDTTTIEIFTSEPVMTTAVIADIERRLSEVSSNVDTYSNHSLNEEKEVFKDLVQVMEENESIEFSKEALNDSVKILDSIIKNDVNGSIEDNIDIILAFETLSTKVKLKEGEKFTLESDTVSVETVQVMKNASDGLEYFVNETIPGYGTDSITVIRSRIPEEAMNKATLKTEGTPLKASFILYKNTDLFKGAVKQKNVEIGQVLSASVGDVKITNLKQDFWFQLPNKQRRYASEDLLYRCAYLDEEKGVWSSKGCKMIPGSKPLNCSCDHMTNFALLVKHVVLPEKYALDIIGKVGCSLSIIGLGLVLICYTSFRSLRKVQLNLIHANLCACLLIAYLVFLVGVERTENKIGCIVVAAILQYFLLSSWGWMAVECITMYKKLVLILSYTGYSYIAKAAAVVYTSALAIVAVTIGITVGYYDKTYFEDWHPDSENKFKSFYVSERMCWMSGYPLYLGFLTPVGILFAINLIVFILISVGITCYREKIQSSRSMESKSNEVKCYIVRASIISFFIGLNWIFAIPLTISDDLTTNRIFSWLFCIFNSLQGFAIFFLFCVRRRDVRDLWVGKLSSTVTSLTSFSTKSSEDYGMSMESSKLSKTDAPTYTTTDDAKSEMKQDIPAALRSFRCLSPNEK